MQNKLKGSNADFDVESTNIRYPGFLRIAHKGIVMYLRGDLKLIPSKNIAILAA